MSDLEILKLLLEDLELQKTHLRPTKSYGAGHPWVEKAGIMRELKKRRYFMTPSQKRKEKRKAAEKRRRKEEANTASK